MGANHGRPFVILRAGIEDGEERRQIKRSDSGRPQGQSVAYAMRAYNDTGEPNGWHAGVYLDRWVNRLRSVRMLPGRFTTHTDAGSAAWEARVL